VVFRSLVGLSFFDDAVSLDVNRKMVSRLNFQGDEKNIKRVAVAHTKGDTTLKGRRAPPLVQELKQLPSSLDGFVTENTKTFLEILGVPPGFMDIDPREWPENDSYVSALATVKYLRVINDTAERGVALAEEYKDKLTSDGDHKRALYQVSQ